MELQMQILGYQLVVHMQVLCHLGLELNILI